VASEDALVARYDYSNSFDPDPDKRLTLDADGPTSATDSKRPTPWPG
jgi:hypothetical protein